MSSKFSSEILRSIHGVNQPTLSPCSGASSRSRTAARTSAWHWHLTDFTLGVDLQMLGLFQNEQHFIFSSSFPSFWNVLRGHLKPVWKVPIRPSNKVKAAKVIQYASHEDTWHCSVRKSPITQGNHIRSHGCALFVCTVRSTYRIRANWMPLEPIPCKVQHAPTLVTTCCNML